MHEDARYKKIYNICNIVYGDGLGFYNADNEIRAQYNPFVKENVPPKVYDISVEKHATWGVRWVLFAPIPYVSACYATITITVKDAWPSRGGTNWRMWTIRNL